MPLRVGFLIVAAAVILHVSFWPMLVILIGYGICAEIEKWLANKEHSKAQDKVDEAIDWELFGWKQDPERPEWESKDDSTRRKLPQNEQIIVTRVVEILRMMPSYR